MVVAVRGPARSLRAERRVTAIAAANVVQPTTTRAAPADVDVDDVHDAHPTLLAARVNHAVLSLARAEAMYATDGLVPWTRATHARDTHARQFHAACEQAHARVANVDDLADAVHRQVLSLIHI